MSGDALSVDEMIGAAQAVTGLIDFDSDSFMEGLEILVNDINGDSERSAAGRVAFRSDIVARLAQRLQVADYIRHRPALLDAPVKRPLFVFGIPRTGTTLASNLLAADPGRRSLLDWETKNPVPPPRGDQLHSDPRALAQLEQERENQLKNPSAGRFYRASAIYPTECIFAMSSDFKSLYWESHGPLPTYSRWVLHCDTTPTYQYHKKFLQMLQVDAPGIWNLKMPSHALYLDALLKVYPDARLVWTHRDPYTATASLCSLIAQASHPTFYGRADKQWIAQNYPAQASAHVNRVMAVRDRIGQDRIYDLHYADMIRDPIETFRRLYSWLGDDFDAAAEQGMRGWLADNPQGKFGRHDYRLGEFGLTVDMLAPLFHDYLSHHDVEREG